MARNFREVIAALPAERRAKIVAAHTQKLIAEEQKLIAEKKMWQWEEAKRVMELDYKTNRDRSANHRTSDYRRLGLDAYRPRPRCG
ncbi:MAG: hypothetical protein WB689_35305 [Xanthobacteraceae bacterium]